MNDFEKYLIYGLVGVGAGYGFYKLTTPVPGVEVPEEEYVEIKFPPIYLPKTVSKAKIQELINKIKPKITPSFVPLGCYLEFETISVDTPIGAVSFAPPKKFLPLKDILEARRVAQQFKSQVKIIDRGVYWEVKLPSIRIKT